MKGTVCLALLFAVLLMAKGHTDALYVQLQYTYAHTVSLYTHSHSHTNTYISSASENRFKNQRQYICEEVKHRRRGSKRQIDGH